MDAAPAIASSHRLARPASSSVRVARVATTRALAMRVWSIMAAGSLLVCTVGEARGAGRAVRGGRR
jgi:hypothetical protein